MKTTLNIFNFLLQLFIIVCELILKLFIATLFFIAVIAVAAAIYHTGFTIINS